MPFDDDDAKIRRNLVIYSALVLTLAWLDLPLGTTLDMVLPKEVSRPPDYKLWVLAFAILSYLGLRYSFSLEGSQYRESIARDYKSLEFDKCMKVVKIAARIYSRIGFQSKIFQDSIEQNLLQQSEGVNPEDLAECGRPKFAPSVSTSDKTPWEFYLHLNPIWEKSGRIRYAVNGGNGISVRIYGVPKLVVISWATLHAWTYTKSSVQHLIPVLLGISASCVLWTRVIQAYIAAW